MGIVLYIIAKLIGFIFIPISIIYSIVESIWNRKFIEEGYPLINSKFRSMAVSFDIYGNVVGKELLNRIMIKDKTIHPFGQPNETISEAIGWNKISNNLSGFGRFIDSILEFWDENHSINAIKK